MLKITYFHRHSQAGFSINKVSQTYIDEVGKQLSTEQFYVPCYRADPISCLRNIYFVFKHRNRKGINHITGDIHYCAIALIGCKSVLTIHDHSSIYCTKNPVKRFFLKLLWFKIPMQIVTKVVSISEYTKENILKISERKDIEVIYNAVAPLFQPVPKEFNKNRPVILQVGTGWNKNLLNTILALSSIVCHLRIIGKLSSEQQEALERNQVDYSVQLGLTDEEIVEEYKNCDIVCFCSVYEGFGMPIIEGNATGRCVITSLISPMTEIAWGAACFIDPSNVDSIRDGFRKLITDDSYRMQLVLLGFDNVKRFQPTYAAKQYLNLYHSL